MIFSLLPLSSLCQIGLLSLKDVLGKSLSFIFITSSNLIVQFDVKLPFNFFLSLQHRLISWSRNSVLGREV